MQELRKFLRQVPSIPPGACGKIFHGPKGLLPGWEWLLADKLGNHVFAVSYRNLTDEEQAELIALLRSFYPDCSLRLQYRRGGVFREFYLSEDAPESMIVREDGLSYLIHSRRGMNCGFFPDMIEGRRAVAGWLKSPSRGAKKEGALKVLNLFAFTCSFSVRALNAGAAHVDNWDMNRNSLNIGRENHRLNGLDEGRFSCFAHDIFKSFSKIGRRGPYDLMIFDPPPRQVGSFLWKKDYPRLMRRIPSLLLPGGAVLFCLNAPECTKADFKGFVREATENLFKEYEDIPCPPEYRGRYPDRGLKTILAKGYALS